MNTRLRALARERGVPLRHVINDALRTGCHAAAINDEPYVVPTRQLGVGPGLDLDKAMRLASELEDDDVGRKFELRK